MAAALKIENLNFAYGPEPVLKEIDLLIEDGDFIGIVGPNGSGKTTLLKNICRTLPAGGGRVLLKGKPVAELPAREIAKRLAVVPQELTAAFPFTVWEMVSMGRHPYMGRFASLSPEDKQIVKQALNEVGLTPLSGRFYSQLSGGEKQKVLIAQALAQQTDILLLDEPTSHLDISHQLEVMNLVTGLNQERGHTIIAVMHDLNLAANFCRKIILLRSGRIFQYGPTAAVLTADNLSELFQTEVAVTADPATGKINISYLV